MTIVEAVSRLARHHARRDYSALTVAELADAVQGLNFAMQQLYQQLPVGYRHKTVSMLVPGPRETNIVAFHGATTLQAVAFDEDEFGRTVVTSGDSIRHRVGGTAELADAWLGATGTHPVTIYGDAVAGSEYPLERLVSAPVILSANGEERTLAHYPPNEHGCGDIALGSVGEPRVYWLQMVGNSQGLEPVMLIRVLPLPDRPYRMRYVASFGPRRIRVADVETGAPLPVPENFADALLALALVHLASLPGWTVDVARAREGAAAALQFIQLSRIPLHAAPNRVGTPRGY